MGLNTAGGTGAIVTGSSITPPYPAGSISYWLRPTSVSGTNRIMGSSTEFEARLSGSQLFNDFGTGGPGELGSVATLSVSTNYHVVQTYNVAGSTAQQVYINGVLDNSGSATAVGSIPSAAFTIGNRTGSPAGEGYNGDIYDVRIYNRVLSAGEVATMYSALGVDGIWSGLVYRWLCNEGSQGVSISGSGAVRDHGPNKNNCSVSYGTPIYTYIADLRTGSRRRAF